MPLYKIVGEPDPDDDREPRHAARSSPTCTPATAPTRRDLLLRVPFLRNSLDFSFDSEMLMQASHFGFRIAEVPARTRYFEEASSITFGPATVYGIKTLWAAARLMLHRRGILRSRKFAR